MRPKRALFAKSGKKCEKNDLIKEKTVRNPRWQQTFKKYFVQNAKVKENAKFMVDNEYLCCYNKHITKAPAHHRGETAPEAVGVR